MQSYFNPQSEANRIGMLRSHYRGTFLLVEGDADCRFFSTFVDLTKCKIVPAHGKANVLDTIKELETRNIAGILGIVDADFWIIEGIRAPTQNVLITETHDLESIMLLSGALEKVVREYVPGTQMDTVTAISDELRGEVVHIGLPLGYVRWVSWREGYDLKFDELEFSNFVDSRAALDLSKLLQEIRSCTNKRGLPSDQQIRQKIALLEQSNSDPWHICQGHDLVALIKFALPPILRKRFGSDIAKNAERRLHRDQVERELRQAFGAEHFKITQLWNAICNWELLNGPFLVLSTNLRSTA
jgi:hypothetical protein